MLRHRKWLLEGEPPIPKIENYGIVDDAFPLNHDHVQRFLEFLHTIVKSRIGYIDQATQLGELLKEIDFKQILKQDILPMDENSLYIIKDMARTNDDFVSLLHNTQKYHADLRHRQAWENWLATRNEERKAIEKKCGYDGKDASHCLRLLFMGYELLTEKRITVNRRDAGDADFLLAVKQGEVSYQVIDSMTTEWFDKVKNVKNQSTLPNTVDMDLIDYLSSHIIKQTCIYPT